MRWGIKCFSRNQSFVGKSRIARVSISLSFFAGCWLEKQTCHIRNLQIFRLVCCVMFMFHSLLKISWTIRNSNQILDQQNHTHLGLCILPRSLRFTNQHPPCAILGEIYQRNKTRPCTRDITYETQPPKKQERQFSGGTCLPGKVWTGHFVRIWIIFQ